MKFWISYCIVGLFFWTTVQCRTLQEKRGLVNEFVNSLLGCKSVVGFSVAVVKGNDTLLAEGYGLSDLEKNITATNETIFSIASISKQFGATLLGILLKEKGFSWDTPVRDILGDQFYFNDAVRSKYATVRDVLSHRMGLPSNNGLRLQAGMSTEMITRKIRFLNTTEQFRSSYIYSNLMYGVASYVAERLGEKEWKDLVRDKIYNPLNMDSSTFQHEVNWTSDNVAKHYYPPRRLPTRLLVHWAKLGASGSVMTNALDIAKYMKMQLNLGVSAEGVRIMAGDIIRETHKPVNTVKIAASRKIFIKPRAPVTMVADNYGLGFFTGFYRGYPIVMHTGTSLGQVAMLTFIPSQNLAVFMAAAGGDRGYKTRYLLSQYLIDLYSDWDPWINSSNVCDFPRNQDLEKSKNRVERSIQDSDTWQIDGGQEIDGGGISLTDVLKLRSTDQSDNTNYIGTYGNFAYGNVTITVNETDLILYYGDFGYWKLKKKSQSGSFEGEGQGDMWVLSRYFSQVEFSRPNSDGKMTVLSAPSLESRSVPVFYRGLLMSDAPPPPELECPQHSKANKIPTYTLIYVILILMLFLSN